MKIIVEVKDGSNVAIYHAVTLGRFEELRNYINHTLLDPQSRMRNGAEGHECPECEAEMVEVAPGRHHCKCGEEIVGHP